MSAITAEKLDADLFASFDIKELEVLEVSDSVALPEMGASSSTILSSVAATEPSDVSLCCSSSSSTCCCC